MNEYIVEITQVLKREVKISCYEKILAEITVRNMFENGEIRLNQDDCIQSEIKVITSKEDDQPSLFDDMEVKSNGINN